MKSVLSALEELNAAQSGERQSGTASRSLFEALALLEQATIALDADDVPKAMRYLTGEVGEERSNDK